MGGELEGAEYELPEGDTPPFYNYFVLHQPIPVPALPLSHGVGIWRCSITLSWFPRFLSNSAHMAGFFSVVIKIIFAG